MTYRDPLNCQCVQGCGTSWKHFEKPELRSDWRGSWLGFQPNVFALKRLGGNKDAYASIKAAYVQPAATCMTLGAIGYDQIRSPAKALPRALLCIFTRNVVMSQGMDTVHWRTNNHFTMLLSER